MAKRSAKHQSFKLTPHKHPKDRVILYVVLAVIIGIFLGLYLQSNYGLFGVAGY